MFPSPLPLPANLFAPHRPQSRKTKTHSPAQYAFKFCAIQLPPAPPNFFSSRNFFQNRTSNSSSAQNSPIIQQSVSPLIRSIERRPQSPTLSRPVTARLPSSTGPRDVTRPRRQAFLRRPPIQHVGNVKLPPRSRPATTSHCQRKRPAPSIRAARVTSPSVIKFRIAVLEIILHPPPPAVHDHIKSVPHSQFPQKVHVAACRCPKPEIISHNHRAQLQLPH